LVETKDISRWNAISKSTATEVVGSYAQGEECVRFTEGFSNFINALNYAVDGPNFKATPKNIVKLVLAAGYFTLHPKIRKYHRMCNALTPNLDITRL
jgi:hypothetical protein